MKDLFGATDSVVKALDALHRVAIISYDRNRVERQIDALLTGLGL
ncbi:MAG TPA: hypothetical protein VFO40_07275 [Chthoniobacterales bacterium]|nr:hypothetical protein [Chthoniobacterales bacterium]